MLRNDSFALNRIAKASRTMSCEPIVRRPAPLRSLDGDIVTGNKLEILCSDIDEEKCDDLVLYSSKRLAFEKERRPNS